MADTNIAFEPMMPGYRPIPASSAASGPAVPPAAPPVAEEEKGIMLPMHDPDTQTEKARIFSTTGERRTMTEFQPAIDAYNAGAPLPEGFSVLKPGDFTYKVRQGFETFNQPFQAGARGLDQLTQPGLQWLANTMRGAMGKRDLSPSEFPPGPFEQTASQFNTPGKAGLNLGLGVASAVAPAVNVAAQSAPALVKAGHAMPTALSGRNLIAGAGITGLLGTGGYVAGKLAAGEKPTYGDTALQATGAVIAGGAKGLIDHLVSKLPRDAGNRLAGEILDEVTKHNPALKADPDVMNIAINNADTLSRVVTRGTQALRGEAGKLADQAAYEVSAGFSGGLTSGQSKHLNTLMRQFGDLGNDLINATAQGDAAAIKKVVTQLDTLKQEVVDHLGTSLSGAPGMTAAAVKRAQENAKVAFQTQAANLDQFVEGAMVFKALKDAGVEGGFNSLRVAQKIAGNYASPPGTQLNRIGDILAGGEPGQTLTSLPTFTSTTGGRKAGLGSAAYQFLSGHPLQSIGTLLATPAPGRTTVQPYLPWQGMPTTLPAGVPAAVQQEIQQAGAAALRGIGYGGVAQHQGDTTEEAVKRYMSPNP